LYVDESGRPVAGFTSALEEVSITADTRLSTTSWSFLAATFNGNVLRLYFNGNELNERAVSAQPKVTSEDVFVGCRTDRMPSFSGYIDELRIYPHPMNAADLNKLYHAAHWFREQPTAERK
jgi:hypothetical protein